MSALASISDGGWLNIRTCHTGDAKTATSGLPASIPAGSVQLSISDTSYEETELWEPGDSSADKDALSIASKNAAVRRSVIATVSHMLRDCGLQISMTASEDAGTRIDIFFPKATDIGLPPKSLSASPKSVSGSETIFLVDDDVQVRNFVKCALESHGYQVIEAEDGSSAIRMATEHSDPLHLLVTDLRLGRSSGREIADRLRSEYPGLPVIFMSGLARDDLPVDACTAFLEKPFKPVDLMATVRRLLDLRLGASGSQ